MNELLQLLPGYLLGHRQLTLVALAAGTAVSVPAGVLAARVEVLGRPLLAVASVIQTVPSLALLALMVPLLATLGTASIGYLPATWRPPTAPRSPSRWRRCRSASPDARAHAGRGLRRSATSHRRSAGRYDPAGEVMAWNAERGGIELARGDGERPVGRSAR